MIKIVTVCIDYDVDHEHYCYDTVQGAHTWSQEIGFPKCLQTYFTGTTSTDLSRSSPNCWRADMIMPVLLFPPGWDQPNPHVKSLQALVVVGGKDGSNPLSTVLTLLPGATAWTPLASLPRALVYSQASIVGGKMRVTGGYDGSSRRSEVVTNNYSDAMWVYCWCDFCPSFNCQVLEYQPDQNKWSNVGNLQVARYNHAVLSVGPNQLPCL